MDIQVENTINSENPFKICFVCLGNICRSPTAEGIFQHLVKENGLEEYFEVDSAGTSAYHIGESANTKSQQTAQKYGITLHSKARKFKESDLDYFDLIVVMDRENYQNVKRLYRDDNYDHKIAKMRDFDPHPGDGNVPDPYYGGMDGFEHVFQIVKRSCEELLSEIEHHIED